MRRHAPLGGLLLAVAVVALLVELGRGYIDLDVYRFGGRAVLDGVPLYVADDPSTGLPFTYPPFAALLMVVPAVLPGGVVAVLWAVAGVAALAGTIALVLAESGDGAGDRATPARVAALTALALPFEPVWQNLSFGQVNLFLMLLVTADLLRAGDRAGSRVDSRWAGVLIGIAAGVKLTPLVFVVLLVLIGRRTAALRAAGTFVATVALGFAVLPSSATAYWTDVLWDPGRVGGVEFVSNQSVNGVLARLLGGEGSTPVWVAVTGPLALAVLGLAALCWRRGVRDLGLCLAAVAMLLASPISWSHHWVWAVPIALVLLRLTRRWAAGPWVLAAWTALFVSACLWQVPNRDGRELSWSVWDQVVGDSYVWAGLLLAAGSAVWLTRTGPAPASPQGEDPRERRGPGQVGVGADLGGQAGQG